MLMLVRFLTKNHKHLEIYYVVQINNKYCCWGFFIQKEFDHLFKGKNSCKKRTTGFQIMKLSCQISKWKTFSNKNNYFNCKIRHCQLVLLTIRTRKLLCFALFFRRQEIAWAFEGIPTSLW